MIVVRIAFWLIVLTLIATCSVSNDQPCAAPIVVPEVKAPSRPRMCDKYYDNASHTEWMECMGVGYTPYPDMEMQND